MSMRSQWQVSIAIVLLSALCACGSSTPPLQVSGTDKARVWTGLSCSSATREEDRLLVSSTPHGAKTTCVDRGAAHIDYRKDTLRILPYRAGITALQLRCVSKQQANSFFREAQDRLAILVAGENAIATYRVGPPTMGCGWHGASDLLQAVAQCERIADAWSMPSKRCSTLCDQTRDANASSICVANTRTR